MKQVYVVKGMHCASCSTIITRTLKKLPGVETCEVNPGTEKATIERDPAVVSDSAMNAALEPLGYSIVPANAAPVSKDMSTMDHAEHLGMDHSQHTGASQTKAEKLKELAAMKMKMDFALPITLVTFAIMVWDIAAQFFSGTIPRVPLPMELFDTFLFGIAAVMLFWVGKPFIQGVQRFVMHRVANMDTLVGIGTLTAFIYSSIIILLPNVRAFFSLPDYTYFDVTIVVVGFVMLGKYMEAKSKLRTGEAIEKLLNLQAKSALVMRDGKEIEVPVDQVVHGDSIIVKPAGKIPVDGTITEGSSYIDESMVTGEPMPVKKSTGDTVVAGTMNTSGAFTFTATKVGSETLLAHIIKMVEEAQSSRAPIQELADRISAVFVPVVLVIAILSLTAWLAFGSPAIGAASAVSNGLLAFVGILVIACPCALGLATPTAIIVGVGKGAKEGILVKDAATLQKLHKVNVVVVDKTGTITKGKPELVSIKNFSNKSDDALMAILAGLEGKSEHPIAHAIAVYAAGHNIQAATVAEFEALKGLGIKGTIQNTEYYVGSPKLLSTFGLQFDATIIAEETKSGKTPVALATKDEVLAIVMVADAVKPEAAKAIKDLKKIGIKTIMLTGDVRSAAEYIAKEVGIDEVIAEVMPADKLRVIKDLQAKGNIVAMAGDGVNDAPALAQANVGIAMATGTDVAIESAGIALLHGDIAKLVKAVHLSRITMRGIKQNLFWAFIFNIIGIPLAAGVLYPFTGWVLNPAFAGMAMAFSSVAVVSNSLRLKAKRI